MSQPFGLSTKGGLFTSLNQLEMLGQPGVASKLTNFEVDTDGGYRRINGFTIFGGGSAVRPNGANKVLGIRGYADGVIVCSGTGIFFSQDGTSWISIAKQSVHSSGDNYTTFTGRSDLARTGQKQTNFSFFEGLSDYGEILICDGVNKPYFFRMEGTGNLNTRTFFAGEVTVSGTVAPAVGTIHDKHFVVAGAGAASNTIYYSHTNDPDNFSGSGAGSIVLEDQVVGLASFRSDLVIFCKNSIFKLLNINDSNAITVQPVTKNVGCMDAQSIQEIAGDLLFLSPDGLRTIAGTVRIGDVELGTVSRPIQPTIKSIAANIDNLNLTSAVLRSKSQYRLFYNTDGTANAAAKGVIATLTNEGFQYSETEGIKATALTSDLDVDGIEQTWHGDSDGYIYNHDDGISFDYGGSPADIRASYQTPNLDFGDVGTKKTLRYVRLSISPEGAVQPTLRVRYDYEDPAIAQPLDYILDSIPLPSILGSGIFGANVFGAPADPLVRQTVQGSGHTVSFIVTSSDQKSPYTVNGLYIDYTPSGRR
tara:strand:- start:2778 stop:4382 length:1605 start_codon:yes stop_codon:yes gene_type:complete